MLTLAVFGVMCFFMGLGVPIAVSMGLAAILTFVYLGEGFVLPMMAQRMYSATTGFTLLAIPFFILAGNLMNNGGVTARIFRFALALVGHLRGGLGHVNVVSGIIMSGMSGAAVADAVGIGVIEIPAMVKAGYDRRFAAAVTAASSTIGPVIPPSIPFVIYGSLTGVSVGSLFLAGFVPGALMGVAMMVAVYFTAKRRNYPKEKRSTLRELWASFQDAFLALAMPVVIIGGILIGWFTPTEAAVVASGYAFLLGVFIYGEIKWRDLPNLLWTSVQQSVSVLFIIATASFFGWLLIHQHIPEQVIAGLTAMSSNKFVLLAIINLILLILGCFMEGIAVLVITIPIFMPLTEHFGVDPVQFGVIMILNSMIGLLTPPVGMCLFAVSSISGVKIGPLSRELWPYILGIFLVLMLITYVPQVCLFIPHLVMGK